MIFKVIGNRLFKKPINFSKYNRVDINNISEIYRSLYLHVRSLYTFENYQKREFNNLVYLNFLKFESFYFMTNKRMIHQLMLIEVLIKKRNKFLSREIKGRRIIPVLDPYGEENWDN